ncbi:unnamed protein product, partial [Rotaria sordida]
DASAAIFISVRDFNHDNQLDIAVANYRANNIVVLFGFEDTSFLLGAAYQTGIGSGPIALVIDDFDNDTRLDIAVANYLSNDISIFLGYNREPFAGMTSYSIGSGSQLHSIAINDLNNDGWLDIVVADYSTDNLGILF